MLSLSLNEFPTSLVVLPHQDRQQQFHLSRLSELLCATDFLMIELVVQEVYSHGLFLVNLLMVQDFYICKEEL